MDSNASHALLLPPNKRFKHQHQPQPQPDLLPANSYSLPAKKRVSLHPPTLLPAPATPSLPAKKRVWALPPDFDLNSFPPSPPPDDDNDKDDDNDDEVEVEDGIVCAICQSTDGDPADPIVLCDGCDLMVHVSCYGSPLIHGVPSGDWFCVQCSRDDGINNTRSTPPSCCLCPNTGGALKRVVDGDGQSKWAHVVCAVFVPEVFFRDAEGRDGIDCSNVPARRFEKECYVCGRGGVGCVVDCSEPKCGLGFHVTCGLREELCFEYRQGKRKSDVVAGFCKTHSDLWIKQEGTGKFKIVARGE